MTRSPEELAQSTRFAAVYARSRAPVMLTVERSVCGCDYGGNSWTTQAEAARMGTLLELRPGRRLLDLGAGAGWPALYLAETSGCDVVLVDLPEIGLRIAADRARRDGISGDCGFAVADAAGIPFPDGSFDAVSHSDLLCCLKRKRAVLEDCRRVIRDGGRMVFTVISTAPGLGLEDHGRAVESGPEFVESEADYLTLLGQCGWRVLSCEDITAGYLSSCRRQILADKAQEHALQELIGAAAFAERQASWQTNLQALEADLLRREVYVATPDLR